MISVLDLVDVLSTAPVRQHAGEFFAPIHHERDPNWRMVPPSEWKRFDPGRVGGADALHDGNEWYEYTYPQGYWNTQDPNFEQKQLQLREDINNYLQHFQQEGPNASDAGPFGHYTFPDRPGKMYFWRKLPKTSPTS